MIFDDLTPFSVHDEFLYLFKHIFIYCIAESTVYANTDRPYLVIPVYMPCSRGPDKVKPVNGPLIILMAQCQNVCHVSKSILGHVMNFVLLFVAEVRCPMK